MTKKITRCLAPLNGQDETYLCDRPALHGSTRCTDHIDYRIEKLEERNQQIARSIVALQAELKTNNEELVGLHKAVIERESPNT